MSKELTVEEMAEMIATGAMLCPIGKEPILHTCLTTSCAYCWSQAPEAEIRAAYEKMKAPEAEAPE